MRPPGQPAFRATIEEPRIATDFYLPKVGDVVQVRYDPRSHKVKFDH